MIYGKLTAKSAVFLLAASLATALNSHANAATTLVVDSVEPSTASLVTGHIVDGGSYTRVFDPDASKPGDDRGQTFTTRDIPGDIAVWLVDEITVVADDPRDLSGFPNTTLTLWVFRWNAASATDMSLWEGGDGVNDLEGPFDGTGITSFQIDGDVTPAAITIAAGDFLHFRFLTPLRLLENAPYGFLLSFDDGDVTGMDLQLQQSRDTVAPTGEPYPDGSVLAPQSNTHINASQYNDDLRFYLSGAPSTDPDSDGDGLTDAWEIEHFGDLSRDGSGDFDGDGLTDGDEFLADTEPANPDTDGDLLRDGVETGTGVYVDPSDTGTDPRKADTDDDGTPDHLEAARGLDPNNPAERLERPNIIFILTDDLGWGDLGSFFQNNVAGPKKHATPRLDSMAAAGLQFRNHYCPAPVCAPSRGSLLGGVHQGHSNVRNNSFDKAIEGNHTLATVLKTAGYSTALIGKYGLQGDGSTPDQWPAYPTKRGFDTFFGYVRHGDGHTHYPAHVTDSRGTKELYDQDRMIRDDLTKCYTADLFTARAKKRIVDETSSNPQRPFFLLLAFDTPHAALQLPTQAYPAGGGLTGGIQWLGTPGAMINTASGTIDSYRHSDYTGLGWTDVEERFATSVRRIDDCVGDVLKTLDDLGLSTNTLVVFSSDNGPHKESYLSQAYAPTSFDSFGPFDGIKRDTWEGGIRMPTLVRWTGMAPKGGVIRTPSQFQDWMPTFCELAGYPSPSRTDGVSLVPTITGVGQQKQGLVYVEYYNNSKTPTYTEFDPSHRDRRRNQMQVILMEGYKGVRYNIQSHSDDFEIYEVEGDPGETVNLSGTTPFFDGLQQRMKDRVLRVRKIDPDYSRPFESALVSSSTVTVAPGVSCAAYEGLWPWLPEFRDFAPVRRGRINDLKLSLLTRSDNAGLLFNGHVNIPANGEWNFHLQSDSGASLRIHESQVIDDDFTHTGTEASGMVRLEAGWHPFRLYYHTDDVSTPSLSLQWSGPGVAKAPVPTSAFGMPTEPGPFWLIH